jgi:hypothetical protein
VIPVILERFVVKILGMFLAVWLRFIIVAIFNIQFMVIQTEQVKFSLNTINIFTIVPRFVHHGVKSLSLFLPLTLP